MKGNWVGGSRGCGKGWGWFINVLRMMKYGGRD